MLKAVVIKIINNEFQNIKDNTKKKVLTDLLLKEVKNISVKYALELFNENQTKAAKFLGINRGTLSKIIKEGQIDPVDTISTSNPDK